MFDFLIVGAGFAGCVLAERIASKLNKSVLLIDGRGHIGGNAYDYYNEDGILVHKYGPHIFHTDNKRVFDYLSQFTKWRIFELRVTASVDGHKVPIPINLDTINELYGFNFNEKQLVEFFKGVAKEISPITNSEEIILSKVGEELYSKFFKYYTKKQWDLWPSELDASVCARIPIRTNRDNRYFSDKYQVMPKHGYTEMFKKMINHPNIHLMLQTDFLAIKEIIPYKYIIYTGPIDSFFNYKLGKLPYRSLRFSFQTLDQEYFQDTGIVNYPYEYDFTRITEFKHLTGQKHTKTTIAFEYPAAQGEPYYPIPQASNWNLYQKYQTEAEKIKNIWFIGRLGTYQYLNMDQAVAQALDFFENTLKKVK